ITVGDFESHQIIALVTLNGMPIYTPFAPVLPFYLHRNVTVYGVVAVAARNDHFIIAGLTIVIIPSVSVLDTDNYAWGGLFPTFCTCNPFLRLGSGIDGHL